MFRQSQQGFTLVEMIMVIVITGIIGSMVAVFLKAPIQQYMDVSRRADMTDIADTALRRVGRDLRLALSNSVRVTNAGTYLEYLETIGGGRYNTTTVPPDCMNAGACTKLITTGNLVTGAAGAASVALVNGGTITIGTSRLVVYNQYNNSGSNCSATNPSVYCGPLIGGAPLITGVSNGATDVNADEISITVAGHTYSPAGGSPQNRFQIVSQPVTYVCSPDSANPLNGTLRRYAGYAIQPVQPNSVNAANQLLDAGGAVLATGALLASNVGTCSFAYEPNPNAVAQRSGLVTMNLGITIGGETVTLYSATHVSNLP